MQWICIALALGCQVFAARAVKNIDQSERPRLLFALGAACLMFDGWSLAQGLSVSENARWAPYEARQAGEAQVLAVTAKLDSLPRVPLSDEAGRSIGPQRTAELGAQRQAEVARLQGLRSEALAKLGPSVVKPSPRMPWGLELAIAGLVAMLELFGFATIAGRKEVQAEDTNVIDISAAARALVGKRKDRQPAT